MIFSHVHVTNYRCLREVDAPLSNFSTIIGENNSGKSSLLQTLLLFIRGSKLTPQAFYDRNSDIVIEVTLTGFPLSASNGDGMPEIDRLKALHVGDELKLVRRYQPDGTSTLRCRRLVPLQDRFLLANISTWMKGVRGDSLREKAEELYPELVGKIETTTQEAIRSQIDDLGGDRIYG